MKKRLTFLFSSLIVFLMFSGPINLVTASELEEPCLCEDVSLVTGAEKNKIVANLLKTNALKDLRKDQLFAGIKWNGVNEIQVLKHNVAPVIIVGIPFTSEDGILMMAVFINGEFEGVSPADGDSHTH